MGSVWGSNPEAAGLIGTISVFVNGHINLYSGKDRSEMWSVGSKLVSGFKDEFGSLSCRELTGTKFESERELSNYIDSTDLCEKIQSWCRQRATELIKSYT